MSTSKKIQVKVVKAADRHKPPDWDLMLKQADAQVRHTITMMELAKAHRQMIVTMREQALKQ